MVVVGYLRTVLAPSIAATLYSIPNERSCSAMHGDKLNKMGRAAGAADLGFVWQGRAHFLELKLRTDPAFGTKRTRQSEAQKAWQAAVEAAGALYAVCRHTEEVERQLIEWGVPTRISASSVRAMEA